MSDDEKRGEIFFLINNGGSTRHCMLNYIVKNPFSQAFFSVRLPNIKFFRAIFQRMINFYLLFTRIFLYYYGKILTQD